MERIGIYIHVHIYQCVYFISIDVSLCLSRLKTLNLHWCLQLQANERFVLGSSFPCLHHFSNWEKPGSLYFNIPTFSLSICPPPPQHSCWPQSWLRPAYAFLMKEGRREGRRNYFFFFFLKKWRNGKRTGYLFLTCFNFKNKWFWFDSYAGCFSCKFGIGLPSSRLTPLGCFSPCVLIVAIRPSFRSSWNI